MGDDKNPIFAALEDKDQSDNTRFSGLNIENMELGDIIDVPATQKIMDDFNKFTHLAVGILDLKSNALVAAGWQDICTKFHRVHPQTCRNCVESETELTKGVLAGEYKLYKCKNNMWDIVTPLMVNGKHIGNIFLGQFIFDDETVDYGYFTKQASKYGFAEKEYLAALEQVPRLSHEAVDTAMSFFAKFAQMLSLLSFRNIQLARSLIEHNILLESLSRDITQRKLAEKALLESETKHKAMIENIADVITVLDERGFVKYISPNVEKLFGWRPQELIESCAWLRVHPDDVERLQNELLKLLKNEGSVKTIEFKYKYKDESYKDIELTAVNLINDKIINGVLMNYHDISQRKQKEREIQYLNYHDVLTGLYNRAFFEEEKERLDKLRQWPLSIIIGDINGLKLINDAFGHAEGDKCLVRMANILRSCTREGDILARVGGDEFSILLPNTTSEAAQQICNQIESDCIQYESITDKEVYYTSISLGHATKTMEHEPFERIALIAEEFMYKRKLLDHKSVHSAILTSMKTTMFEKSQETEEHAERLVELSKSVGQALNLNDAQLNELELLATLHDVGKISIDHNILNKPGKLTEKEMFEIKKHPEVGYRIAQASAELKPIADYILCHHEYWNGRGYPQGLAGEAIPYLSRIISVVDAYDAMTQDRPYRKAMPKEAAIAEIIKHAGTQFDPDIAKVFVENVLGEMWE